MLYKYASFGLCKGKKMVKMLKNGLTAGMGYDMIVMLGRLSEWLRFLHISPRSCGFLSTSPWKRFKIRKLLAI